MDTYVPIRQALVRLAAMLLAVPALMTLAGPARADAPAQDESTARYEIRLMTSMIDHHQMAIEMSRSCVDKAVHRELADMCSSIVAAQSQEIDTMQGWLRAWYGVGHEPEMTTGAVRSMSRLERLDGEAYEIAFMRSMNRHHWAAVREAQQCVNRAGHEALISLCQEIITAQLEEIEQMSTWLCQWYDRCGGRPAGTA